VDTCPISHRPTIVVSLDLVRFVSPQKCRTSSDWLAGRLACFSLVLAYKRQECRITRKGNQRRLHSFSRASHPPTPLVFTCTQPPLSLPPPCGRRRSFLLPPDTSAISPRSPRFSLYLHYYQGRSADACAEVLAATREGGGGFWQGRWLAPRPLPVGNLLPIYLPCCDAHSLNLTVQWGSFNGYFWANSFLMAEVEHVIDLVTAATQGWGGPFLCDLPSNKVCAAPSLPLSIFLSFSVVIDE
jgi:hypothetical protein